MAIQKLTLEQATILTVKFGYLLLDPQEFRRRVGEKLGRKVHPAEFASEEFQMELMELYADDFAALEPEMPSMLILPSGVK